MAILRCVSCGDPADPDALMLTIEASAGLRITPDYRSFVSTTRTVTRGVMVCDKCYPKPELAILRAIICHESAEPDLHRGRGCFVLCRHMKRKWWHRLALRGDVSRPTRGRVTCPSCGRYAHAWSVEGAPPVVKGLADDVVLGPDVADDEPESPRSKGDRVAYHRDLPRLMH